MVDVAVIPSFPDYEISCDGRVFRRAGTPKCRARRELTTWLKNGYPAVSLSKDGKVKKRYVHHLVMDVFCPPSPSPLHHIAHFDGDKNNSHANNLRWATQRENEADKRRHGRLHLGEDRAGAKLTNKAVRLARKAHAAGQQVSSIAKANGVGRETMTRAINGTTWSHVA